MNDPRLSIEHIQSLLTADLDVLTCVFNAKKAIANGGSLADVIACLKVDADKIRGFSPALYEIINATINLAVDIPPLPVLDEDLAREAEVIATGARVHDVMAMIGIYRNCFSNIERLSAMIRESGYQGDDREELARRIAAAGEYERKVRAFVSTQRQLAAKFKHPQE